MIESQIFIYKDWRSEIGRIGFFFLSSIACVVFSRLFPVTIIPGTVLELASSRIDLMLPVLWLIPAGALMSLFYRIYNVRYALDDSGIESVVGRLAFRQMRTRIRYEDIRSIETDQTILERILDIGTVEMGTAASAGIEMVLEGVRSPVAIQRLVQEERDERIEAAEQDARPERKRAASTEDPAEAIGELR